MVRDTESDVEDGMLIGDCDATELSGVRVLPVREIEAEMGYDRFVYTEPTPADVSTLPHVSVSVPLITAAEMLLAFTGTVATHKLPDLLTVMSVVSIEPNESVEYADTSVKAPSSSCAYVTMFVL